MSERLSGKPEGEMQVLGETRIVRGFFRDRKGDKIILAARVFQGDKVVAAATKDLRDPASKVIIHQPSRVDDYKEEGINPVCFALADGCSPIETNLTLSGLDEDQAMAALGHILIHALVLIPPGALTPLGEVEP